MGSPDDVQNLARKYVALWKEQLAVLTADPSAATEVQRAVHAMLAGTAAGRSQGGTGSDDDGEQPTGGASGATGTTGAQAAAAAPDGRVEQLDQLARSLAECQARLVSLAFQSGGKGGKSDP